MNNTFSALFEHYQQQRSRLNSLTERLLILAETLHSPALMRELRQARSQLYTNTLKILVAGACNAGKSTIVNALIWQRVLPTYPVPTTAMVTRIKKGVRPEALLHRHPSRDERQQPPLSIALTEMEPYLVFNENNEPADGFEEAEVFLPLPPIYEGIEFIDVISPYDDDGYDEAIENNGPSADIVLYVLRCDAPVSKEEALRIDWIKNMGNAALLFLCNRFDLVEPRSQSRIRQRHLAYLSQLSGADSIFFINAKGALYGYLRDETPQAGQSSFPQMEEALYNALAARGKQKMRSAISELRALLRLSQQIVLLTAKFQHSALQTRADSVVQLYRECEWMKNERQRMDNTFSMIRQRMAEEAASAASAFYREFAMKLDSLVQGYIPQQPCSTWETFGGDAPERLAKHLIAFLTEAIQAQFQTWITSILESLLQDELKASDIGLAQDTSACVTHAVLRRVNRAWHPSILIKRVIDDAQLKSCLEPGIDMAQIKTNIANLYRRVLNTSTDMLIEVITFTIDDELQQRQQALTHRLDLQFRCLRGLAHRGPEDERQQEQNNTATITSLLIALEHELTAIEHEDGDL